MRRYRKANRKDIMKCLKLQKLDNEDYWTFRDFSLALKDKNTIFVVAQEDGEIIGYAIGFRCPTKRSDVMIHETRVNKIKRGQGIGTLLVDRFCKEAFRKSEDIYGLIEPELCKFYIKSCKFKKSHNWIEVKKSR
jgi:predicted GNAT family acetyltransferase